MSTTETSPSLVVRFEMFTNQFISKIDDGYTEIEDLFWNPQWSADQKTYDLKLNTYISGYIDGLCAGLTFDETQKLRSACKSFANSIMQAYYISAGILDGNDNTQS